VLPPGEYAQGVYSSRYLYSSVRQFLIYSAFSTCSFINILVFMICSISAAPSAPTMLKVVRVTADSVTLQWSAPYSDGGSEITRYVVLRQQGTTTPAAGRWEEAGRVTGAATTTFTVQRLREGTPYYFAVYAVNRAGDGDVIETARPTTPKRLISTFCYVVTITLRFTFRPAERKIVLLRGLYWTPFT